MPSYIHGTATATTTAAVLFTSPAHNDGVLLSNRGPSAVFFGGSTVTADQAGTGGMEVAPGEKVTISTVGNLAADLYAVTASGTAVVSWLTV